MRTTHVIGYGLTTQADVFSVGCVLAEAWMGMPLLGGDHVVDEIVFLVEIARFTYFVQLNETELFGNQLAIVTDKGALPLKEAQKSYREFKSKEVHGYTMKVSYLYTFSTDDLRC